MRYEAELSFRFIGDRAECQKYLARARTILGEVWNRDIVLGGLDQSWRSVKVDDRTTVFVYATKYVDPIVTIVVKPDVPVSEVIPALADLRLTWMPEGLVFTPVSAEYEKGWGLPTRHHLTGAVLPNVDPETGDPLHPIGTEGGIWPQVIVNKFPNNKYLDDAAFISGVDESILPTLVKEHPLRRATWDTPYNINNQTNFNTWQILYNPLDCIVDLEHPTSDPGTEYWNTVGNLRYGQIPGIYNTASYADGQLQDPQFGGYLANDLIFEPPSEEWYAHRAEELLYYTPAQEAIFQHTNTLRTNLGLGRMHRIVRGHANTARLSVSEIALSGKQFHDSVEYFRPGYAYIDTRSRSARGAGVADGENLQITTNTGLDWEDGMAVAMSWEGSPVHYDNMVNPIWTEVEGVPGAEHFIDFLEATVDESLTGGFFLDPVTGVEWAQIFSLSSTWIPVPFNYNISATGSVGNYGKVSRYERDVYYGPSYLFLSYRQVLFSIPNNLFTGDDGMGIFGASEYVDLLTGQRRLRAVVGTSAYMYEPPPGWLRDFEEFTLYVITTPLANSGNCEWEIETQISYLFEDGWIPAMEGQVKFSPDGKKFVFTMLYRGASYTEALDYNTEDFNTGYSLLYNPRRSVELHHIVFDSDRPGGEWFQVYAQPPLVASISCNSAGVIGRDEGIPGEAHYTRSLSGEINAFPDWDDNNNLIYIKLVIDERSEQHYEEVPGDILSDNYIYIVRKMVFPSGKEIVYHQLYMRDILTIENPLDVAIEGWPIGDETGDPFFLMFHYINTRDEDVIYTRRETRVRLALRDGQSYVTNYEYGALSIWFDGGWDEIDPITFEQTSSRIQQMLYSEPEGFFNSYEMANITSEFVPGEGWVGLYLDSTLKVYQPEMITAVRAYKIAIGPSIVPIRAYTSLPMPNLWLGAQIETSLYTEGEYPRWPYNAYPKIIIDNSGRPPFESHKTSVIYGVQQRWPEQYMGSNFFWGSSIWGDSFMPTNVAPFINPEYVSLCQVARYNDRVMLRLENRRWPWATVADFTPTGWIEDPPTLRVAATDIVSSKPDWDTVPEEAKLIIWANFDIDEAAGISDVTDIQPFGRAG